MNSRKIKCVVFMMFCCLITTSVIAETAPRWVKKGVTELNKERSNNSYEFRMFHMYDADKRVFEQNRLKALLEYVDSTYGASRAEMRLDSLPVVGDQRTTYTVSFNHKGKSSIIYAQLVDEYMKFEDYVDNSFEYNLYQLYAISEPNVMPEFDDFEITRRYKAGAMGLSIIPGLGQIYKGQKAKGFSIMGSEVLLVGGMFYATSLKHHYSKSAKETSHREEYESKVTTFKKLRQFCVIAGIGLYAYNILDAAFVKGARYVKVKHKTSSGAELTFTPVMSSDMAGVGLNFKF